LTAERAGANVAPLLTTWRPAMDVDDYMDPKVGVAVAATAVVFSPRVREVLHRGAVYGLAGVFAVGDAVAALGRGVTAGARRVREERGDADVERELTVADERASASMSADDADTAEGTTTGTGTSGRARRRSTTGPTSETTSADEDE